MGLRPKLREDLLYWKWISWRNEGVPLMTQRVKKVKKMTEVEIVKEKTNSLVVLKEKLLCFSIYAF